MKSSVGGLIIIILATLIGVAVINSSYYDAITFVDSPKVKIPKIKYVILLSQIIYGYSSTPDQTDSTPFTTANGKRVRRGIIANNCYDYGTKIRIKDRTYIVEDRMNARYGCDVFDIWFTTRQEAKNWGKQILDIKIY